MRIIISAILCLLQYLNLLNVSCNELRPSKCPYCGYKELWIHGHYERKSDRESTKKNNLNPIPILRFFCHQCKRTCSVLPECIPPRRWYLWKIQQQVFEKMLEGTPVKEINETGGPSRWTIRRWMGGLHSKFTEWSSVLRSGFSWLGYESDFSLFWQNCFKELSLSQVMLFLNNEGVIIP